MKVLKPTIFPSVPRLFNRIYDRIQAGLKEKSAFKQYIFNKAMTSKQYYLENQSAYTHRVYDKYVFADIKNLTGGRVRLMITGSAPIAGEILTFLKAVFGCPLLEGYGQTETSAPATLSAIEDASSGHVGGPLTCLKVRLRDIPEMSYLSTDENPRGEICFKGPSVFKGYFKAPDKNAEAFDEEGWLRSGDVGMVLPNGAIKIIDRARTSSSYLKENISPRRNLKMSISNHHSSNKSTSMVIHLKAISYQLVLLSLLLPRNGPEKTVRSLIFLVLFVIDLGEMNVGEIL